LWCIVEKLIQEINHADIEKSKHTALVTWKQNILDEISIWISFATEFDWAITMEELLEKR
jgi:hypothetical protein